MLMVYREECDYTENAVTSEVRKKFEEALVNPSHVRRLTLLSDIAKSISKDRVEAALPITHGKVQCSLISETQAERLGTTRNAFYRMIRDCAMNVASEASAMAASPHYEGKEGLKAVAKAEEHMRLAGMCDTVIQDRHTGDVTTRQTCLKSAMDHLSNISGITQDYLKNQHLYHILMA